MKNFFNYTLIIIASLILVLSIYKEHDINERAKKYEETGDKFFESEVYDEAILNYRKSIEMVENNQVNKKIINAYLKNFNINEAVKELENISFESDYINKIQSDILKIYLEQNDYRNFNNYLDKVNEEVNKEYSKNTFNKFISIGKSYEDIKYSPIFNDFIVKKDNKWMIVNKNGRNLNLEKHDIISGIWEDYYTAIDNDCTKIYKTSGIIKSNLKGNFKPFYENYLIKEDSKGMYFVNRAGERQSDIYSKATNFSNGKALIFNDKWKLIDNKFNIIKEIEFKDVKIDEFNNAIYDDKIIFKDKKYIIYDIKNNKFSEKYDDIDFSYGEYIAVKKNKWGYIDQEFNNIIDFKYNEAKSFSLNRGIVKLNGKNYIIDEEGIEYKIIDEIFPFNKNGIGFMKTSNGYEMIKLLRYMND